METPVIAAAKSKKLIPMIIGGVAFLGAIGAYFYFTKPAVVAGTGAAPGTGTGTTPSTTPTTTVTGTTPIIQSVADTNLMAGSLGIKTPLPMDAAGNIDFNTMQKNSPADVATLAAALAAAGVSAPIVSGQGKGFDGSVSITGSPLWIVSRKKSNAQGLAPLVTKHSNCSGCSGCDGKSNAQGNYKKDQVIGCDRYNGNNWYHDSSIPGCKGKQDVAIKNPAILAKLK